jgi:glycosyltransferase involved in cell wall biosynthesis
MAVVICFGDTALKLCFIADGRTPTPQIWLRHLIGEGHEVHLISTYPCDRVELKVSSLHVVPLDFSARLRGGFGGADAQTMHGSPLFARLRGSALWRVLAALRDRSALWAVPLQSSRIRRIVERIRPELVHAMRIPFEGILAAEALRDVSVPLIISVWGNDFTLAAADSPQVARLTRRALARADGLHPDCRRDLHVARTLGFAATKPAAVLPGYGGIRTDVFYPGAPDPALAARLNLDPGAPIVINPRGMKPYVRNDIFFQAIPQVLARRPETIFLGAMMEGNALAEEWRTRLGIEASTRFLPFVSQSEMAGIFRLADVTVSVTDHDGTPNTLLEAMASGVFPVAGDIESVREWIDDGVNGLLCDKESPESLARAILRAFDDQALREAARRRNRQLIAERADFRHGMEQTLLFYQDVIECAKERYHTVLTTSRR